MNEISNYNIIEENLPEPIEPFPAERKRDYLPRGYKHWNRYSGSHVGLKQYKKQTLKLIKLCSTATLSTRIDELTAIAIAPAELNPKVNRERLAWCLERMRAEFHCRTLNPQTHETQPPVPNLPS